MADARDLVAVSTLVAPVVLAVLVGPARRVVAPLSITLWIVSLAVSAAAFASLFLPLDAPRLTTAGLMVFVAIAIACSAFGSVSFTMTSALDRAMRARGKLRALRVLFALALIGSTLLVALAFARARRAPTPARFTSSLVPIGYLSGPPPGKIEWDGMRLEGLVFHAPPMTTNPDPETRPPPACEVRVIDPARAIDERRWLGAERGMTHCPAARFDVEPKSRSIITHAPDRSTHAWVGNDLQWKKLNAIDFAQQLAPPSSWIVTGALGVLVAFAVALLRFARARTRRRELASLVEGRAPAGSAYREATQPPAEQQQAATDALGAVNRDESIGILVALVIVAHTCAPLLACLFGRMLP